MYVRRRPGTSRRESRIIESSERGMIARRTNFTAFFIHEIRMWGPWSPIHLLAVYTLVMLPVGVIAARRHVTERHRRTMVGIFVGGLVIAGLFTFYPGRIMYHVVFGP